MYDIAHSKVKDGVITLIPESFSLQDSHYEQRQGSISIQEPEQPQRDAVAVSNFGIINCKVAVRHISNLVKGFSFATHLKKVLPILWLQPQKIAKILWLQPAAPS